MLPVDQYSLEICCLLLMSEGFDKLLPLDENSDIVLAAGHLGLQYREHLHGLGMEAICRHIGSSARYI